MGRNRRVDRMSIPTIRGAMVIQRMYSENWTPTTEQVQAFLGYDDPSGAYRLMCRLSGADAFGIYQDDAGMWRRGG